MGGGVRWEEAAKENTEFTKLILVFYQKQLVSKTWILDFSKMYGIYLNSSEKYVPQPERMGALYNKCLIVQIIADII